jgi:uncharacterized protein (DUF1015 family)
VAKGVNGTFVFRILLRYGRRKEIEMAEIKAFSCVRPRSDMADKIAALPYDVYNRKEARDKVKNDADSFLRIDRPETQFAEDCDMYAPEVYQKGAQLYQQMLSDGRYERDGDTAYYVYQLVMDGRAQNGIVACASIDDYQNNVIKKHENTREEKEQDRIRHVDCLSAQTGPIFLAYRANAVIRDIVNRVTKESPLYDFVADDGIAHRVWKIADTSLVTAIHDTFAKMDAIYIADGHHRAASAVKVGCKRRKEHPNYDGTEEFNYFLSVLFPDDELMILPYNRVVKDLNGLTPEAFLDKVRERFDVQPQAQAVAPSCKGTFGMYLNRQWYLLSAKPDILKEDPVEGLDVSVLQNELLAPILGIGDPRTDNRIDFVGGIRGLSELERRAGEDMCLAFSMYPTAISELFAVADAGLLMPPKSTWFEPKLRSGIFVHEI